MDEQGQHNVRIIDINQANIDHHHIYLSQHIDLFPADTIGGSSKSTLAKRTLRLHLHGVGSIETDIDGSKKFFRARGPIREFMKQNTLRAGDKVQLLKLGTYEYELRPERHIRQQDPAACTNPEAEPSPPGSSALPEHGKIQCRLCFPDKAIAHTEGLWRITNDPGAWGSSNPQYLVLGFSKGFTQADAYENGPFDAVAFAKFRPRLKAVLVRLGLLTETADIDSLMTAREEDWAFGSLVRCSLCRLDPKTNNWAATGPLVKKSFFEQPAPSYISTCTKHFLSRLPERLRIGILLGNDNDYVDGVRSAFAGIYPTSFEDINPMVFRAGGVLWVNVAHPSGSNGHLQSWLDANAGTIQGEKALMVMNAVASNHLAV